MNWLSFGFFLVHVHMYNLIKNRNCFDYRHDWFKRVRFVFFNVHTGTLFEYICDHPLEQTKKTRKKKKKKENPWPLTRRYTIANDKRRNKRQIEKEKKPWRRRWINDTDHHQPALWLHSHIHVFSRLVRVSFIQSRLLSPQGFFFLF